MDGRQKAVRRWGPVKWCRWGPDMLVDLASKVGGGYGFEFVGVRLWPGLWVGLFLTKKKAVEDGRQD